MGLIIYFENLGGLEHHIGSHLNFLIPQCIPHLFFTRLILMHSYISGELSLILIHLSIIDLSVILFSELIGSLCLAVNYL